MAWKCPCLQQATWHLQWFAVYDDVEWCSWAVRPLSANLLPCPNHWCFPRHLAVQRLDGRGNSGGCCACRVSSYWHRLWLFQPGVSLMKPSSCSGHLPIWQVGVGKGIKRSGKARESLFITSKVTWIGPLAFQLSPGKSSYLSWMIRTSITLHAVIYTVCIEIWWNS